MLVRAFEVKIGRPALIFAIFEDEGMGGAGIEPHVDDVTDLFSHIQRYKPHQIELDTRLKPFIMDFIPTIGQIDAFLKLPRPDNATHIMQLVLGIIIG